MAEYEMFKTTLMGGYDKEEVQELIQKLKDEMAEIQVNYKKQIADRDTKIAELQKRIELKEAYQARMEEDIKEKYQKYKNDSGSRRRRQTPGGSCTVRD